MKFRSSQDQAKDVEAFQQIKQYFNSLNSLIQKTANCFDDRMKFHQNELIKIMIVELKRVQQECRNTILKYNELIRNKKASLELAEARQQILFLKKQLTQASKQNQQLKNQNKYLKKLNNQYQFKMESDLQSLRNIGKRLMAQKQKNKKISKSLIQSIQFKAQSCQQSPQKKLSLPDVCKKENSFLAIQKCQSTTNEGSRIISNQKSKEKKMKTRHFQKNNQLIKSLNLIKIKTQLSSKISSQQNAKQNYLGKLDRKLNQKFEIQSQQQHYQTQKGNISLKEDASLDQTELNKNLRIHNSSQLSKDKIMNFLKQSRPSIKALIQQKRSHNKGHRKSNWQQKQSTTEGKIKMIKNKVKLTTFQQERWQQIKNSMLYQNHQELPCLNNQ